MLRGSSDRDAIDLKGTIVGDDGVHWTLQAKVGSQLSDSKVTVPLAVPLDSIALCHIAVNPEQLKLHPPPAGYRGNAEAYYLGLPDWPWFASNQECGLAW